MAAAGRLNIEITAGTAGFNRGIDRASAGVRGFRQTVEKQDKSMKRFQASLSQAAFAADDFLTVLSIQGASAQGFARALQGAGNNLTAMASAAGPLAVVLTAVGTALASFVIPRLFGATDQTEAMTDAIKKQQEELRKLIDLNREAAIGSEKFAAERLKGSRQEQILRAQGLVGAARAKLDALRKAGEQGDATGFFDAIFSGDPKLARQRRATAFAQGLRTPEFIAAEDNLAARVSELKRLQDEIDIESGRPTGKKKKGKDGVFSAFAPFLSHVALSQATGDLKRKAIDAIFGNPDAAKQLAGIQGGLDPLRKAIAAKVLLGRAASGFAGLFGGGGATARSPFPGFANAIEAGGAGSTAAQARGRLAVKGLPSDAARRTAENTQAMRDILNRIANDLGSQAVEVLTPRH